MQALPHHYQVTASSSLNQSVTLSADGLTDLETDAPAEFGGPGDLWSPETMLAGAIANCLILSFRAIARASKMDWKSIDCEVEAVLERIDRVTKFTKITLKARLTIPHDVDQAKADKILDKSKSVCLITNSMTADVFLEKIIVNE